MGIAEIAQIVDNYFRPLIIVLSTAITILLSSKKIGNSVAAYFSSSWNSLSAERIDDIVLINGFVAQRFHNYMILKVLIIF